MNKKDLSNSSLSLLFVSTLLIIFLTSCSSLFFAMNPPEVTLSNITIDRIELLETTATITLRVENENNDTLEVSNGSYNLYINDSYVGRSLDNIGLTVKPYSTADKSLKIKIDNMKILRQMDTLFSKSRVNYTLRTNIQLVKPFKRLLKLEKKGEVNLFRKS